LKCDYCGKEESLPFVCNYCGGTFCSEHRLPESHNCIGDLSRRPVVQAPGTSSFSWSTGGQTGYSRTPARIAFSQIEIRDIIAAWLALTLAFFIAERDFSSSLSQSIIYFGIALVVVGSGFVLHELMHKFSAERYGFMAEFRMWPMGIVLALVTSVLGFIFAAPGATYINAPGISDKENAIVSAAGPVTNVVIATLFLPLLFVNNNLLNYAGSLGFEVNILLATFNMLPIMPLDGAKVFRWKKLLWAGMFFPLVAVFLLIVGAI
jgi:Zn-dependent protease